jgi:hypothetical protein
MTRALRYLSVALFVTTACQPSGVRTMARTEDHAALLKEARDDYRTVRERPERRNDNAQISNDRPVQGIVVSAWSMEKIDGTIPEVHHWVGAFKSNRPYERLGFGRGMNYIFLLGSGDARHRLVVVPEDMSLDPRYLVYDPAIDLTEGHPDPPLAFKKKIDDPRFIDAFVIGGCVECPIGHCSVTDAGDAY